MSLCSSYKLSEFSAFEINVMVIGIAKYAELTSLGKMESFKLGVYTNGVAENVALVKQRRTGMQAPNFNGIVAFFITIGVILGVIISLITYFIMS